MKSDLIIELAKLKKFTKNDYKEKIVKYKKYKVVKTVSTIISDNAQNIIGKSKGIYITIDVENFNDYNQDLHNFVQNILSKSLSKMIFTKVNKTSYNALIVALGNTSVICDSLGPTTANRIIATRNMNLTYNLTNNISVFKSSVQGKTGIESFEIVKGISSVIIPDIIILIDSLVASNINRLCSSFQISGGGITPGSGVDNSRFTINDNSLNIPTITIGVPVIISAETLCENIIKTNKNMKKEVDNARINKKYSNLCVSPYNIDFLIQACAKIISNSLNKTLHPNLTYSQITKINS